MLSKSHLEIQQQDTTLCLPLARFLLEPAQWPHAEHSKCFYSLQMADNCSHVLKPFCNLSFTFDSGAPSVISTLFLSELVSLLTANYNKYKKNIENTKYTNRLNWNIKYQFYLVLFLLFLASSSSFCAVLRLSASARLSTAIAKKTFSKMSGHVS